MPKALTHLCKKVNLSLFNDTLTVYPKSTGPKKLPVIRNEFELLLAVLFMQMDCASAEINTFFMTKDTELGVYRFVHRNDSDHALYHQDDFDMEDDHYHAQFDKTIDATKLDSICSILERENIITSDEHASFIKAFKEANTLPSVPTKLVTVSVTSSVLVTDQQTSVPKITVSSEQGATTTFAGLKRGFFNVKPTSVAPKPAVVTAQPEQQTASLH
ncbi:hypothetical protein [Legionella waltersii]|nr:hypothetical protein [Legionella waltersii]